jgi:hypothetical protein
MSALIIFYALYYFYWLLKELPTTRLHRLPMFWINAAHIIFYSGNIFLFGLTSYIVNVLKDNLLVYWMLHNALGLLQASMFIIASVMDLRRIK